MENNINWNELFEYKDGFIYWKISVKGRKIKTGKIAGCYSHGSNKNNGKKYMKVSINKKRYYVHRIVWEMHNGFIQHGIEIDHINRDCSDNRIENLRMATRRENSINQPLRKNNRSGFNGIYFLNSASRWVVELKSKNNKKISRYFKNKEDAIHFRKNVMIEEWGEFSPHLPVTL